MYLDSRYFLFYVLRLNLFLMKKMYRRNSSLCCSLCSRKFNLNCVLTVDMEDTDNFICTLCCFQKLPFSNVSRINDPITQSPSDCINDFSLETTRFFNDCNSLEDPFVLHDFYCSKINSKYVSVKEFNNLQNDKDRSFNIINLNIASLNKYSDTLSNFLQSLQRKIEIIGITEHKINVNNFLLKHIPNYKFDKDRSFNIINLNIASLNIAIL